MTALICALIGLGAGVCGGLFGIGGGIVIIPALVYFLGFGQKTAQGTSLVALLAPVGLLSVVNYYKEKQLDMAAGLWIAGGFFIGAYFGSKIALNLDELVLRRSFAVFLVVVGVQLFFRK
jgi:uncharacterized protein